MAVPPSPRNATGWSRMPAPIASTFTVPRRESKIQAKTSEVMISEVAHGITRIQRTTRRPGNVSFSTSDAPIEISTVPATTPMVQTNVLRTTVERAGSFNNAT